MLNLKCIWQIFFISSIKSPQCTDNSDFPFPYFDVPKASNFTSGGVQNRETNLYPCPIHPHRLESSKSTDDSTYRKSSRKRKPILCLPEVKLMDVGRYKMLTTRHDSIGSSRLVPTLVDSTQWKSIGTNLTKGQKNKHQDRNMSKPKHDTRILCITRSINVCKQMIRFKRSFTARYVSL